MTVDFVMDRLGVVYPGFSRAGRPGLPHLGASCHFSGSVFHQGSHSSGEGGGVRRDGHVHKHPKAHPSPPGGLQPFLATCSLTFPPHFGADPQAPSLAGQCHGWSWARRAHPKTGRLGLAPPRCRAPQPLPFCEAGGEKPPPSAYQIWPCLKSPGFLFTKKDQNWVIGSQRGCL